MRIWLALLVAPSLALACQSVLYALVTPSCSVQTATGLHVIAAAFLAATGVFTLLARHEWRLHAGAPGRTPDNESPDPGAGRRWLATVATGVGIVSSLVIVAMWIAVWVLSPCWQ